MRCQVTILFLVRSQQLVAVTAQAIVIICRLQGMAVQVAVQLLQLAQRQLQALAQRIKVLLVAQLLAELVALVGVALGQSAVTEAQILGEMAARGSQLQLLAHQSAMAVVVAVAEIQRPALEHLVVAQV
jgi:hypothetical protein